jgi:hypothetical protein
LKTQNQLVIIIPNLIGNPVFLKTYGFPLEFIPMNIGAGMTLDKPFLQSLFKSGTRISFSSSHGTLVPKE